MGAVPMMNVQTASVLPGSSTASGPSSAFGGGAGAIQGVTHRLPEDLKTKHWYCDIHHAMFLILLERGSTAAAQENMELARYFVDTITVYWLVHCMVEEEGMALELSQGLISADTARAHAESHVGIAKWWNANVFAPLVEGRISGADLSAILKKFLGFVIKHITEVDQNSYGTGAGLGEEAMIHEMAHLGLSGLPLSPQMGGCAALARDLAPFMSQHISAASLPPSAQGPLKTLHLSGWTEPLWTGGKGAFRDVFIAKNGTGSGRSGVIRSGSPSLVVPARPSLVRAA